MASGPGSGHFLIAYYIQDSSLDQRVIQDSFLSLHHCEISARNMSGISVEHGLDGAESGMSCHYLGCKERD